MGISSLALTGCGAKDMISSYESENHTTEREAISAIKTAQDLIRRVHECLEDKYKKELI